MTQITILRNRIIIIDGETVIATKVATACGRSIDDYTKEYFGMLMKTLHDYGLHKSTISAIMEIALDYDTNRPHLILKAEKILSREPSLSNKEVADLMHLIF